MINKIYPIRFSRNSWNIPIYSKHICDFHCSEQLVMSPRNNNLWRLQENITDEHGRCSKSGDIEIGTIKLSDYDYHHPKSIQGIAM